MPRTRESSFPALASGRTDERRSDLIKVCVVYELAHPDAIALIDSMLVTMTEFWSDAADAAELTAVSLHTLWATSS